MHMSINYSHYLQCFSIDLVIWHYTKSIFIFVYPLCISSKHILNFRASVFIISIGFFYIKMFFSCSFGDVYVTTTTVERDVMRLERCQIEREKKTLSIICYWCWKWAIHGGALYINRISLFIRSFLFFLYYHTFSRMMLYNLFSIILVFSSVLLVIANEDTPNTLNILMPDAVADHVCIRFYQFL